jgi:tRNA dimethylallyltransferase
MTVASESEVKVRAHLVFVVGPTACGKSDFAVEAIEAVEARDRAKGLALPPPEIINCDSVQFFAGVEIGAAKPGPDLLARARHHLIGHVPIGGEYTAGDFRRDALKLVESRSREGSGRFFAVGGSGFYVQALEKGMYDVPEIAPEVRSQIEMDLQTKGLFALHTELKERDPEAAGKIQSADRYRIFRALEVLRSAPPGETLTSIRARFEAARPPAPFHINKIGLTCSREFLRRRVTERTRRMLKTGLLEEVEHLRAQGLSAWGPLSSVGYREAQDYLDGRLKFEELEGAIITSTMQLAKRQMTWFRRDAEIRWFDVETGSSTVSETEAGPISYALSLLEP